jgi:dolichol kinase
MYSEYKRKLFHIALGIIMCILIFNVRKLILIPLLTFIILIGVLIRFFVLKGFEFKIIAKFLENLGRPYEVGMGAMYYFIGILISLIFPFPREFSAISVLILGISDGLATVIGLNSKYKIYKSKTFGGTLTFFTTSFLIVLLSTQSILSAIIVPALLTVLELFSPIDDNLLIPFVGTLSLSLINLLI